MKGCFDFNIETLGPCKVPSPIELSKVHGDFIANYVQDDETVRYNVDVFGDPTKEEIAAFEHNLIQKAGPREFIYFNPKHVNAGIFTCGGLCPGLNDVIRAVVRCLWNRYGVRRIRGIQFGFKGLFPEYGFDTVDLTPEEVDDIHKTGGSFLGTSRGGGERVSEIVDGIEALNMNMVFIIGGDGTQRGALEVAEEIEKRNLKISIVGIPKTVDNDLIFIQKSFGFDTAVEHAVQAVETAHMEARSHINGIGLIKLMGREAGFISAFTALASHETNFCLIPEVPFDLEGEKGFLAHLQRRIEKRHHAVVIIAEGAGQELFEKNNKKDASGNKCFGDIGILLGDRINEYFKEKNISITLKYIDPSYQIRSARTTATDSLYCERLGNNAVHAGMAGKTKLLIGLLHNKYVHLPTSLATSRRNTVNPEGSMWRDVIDATGQPVLMKNKEIALENEESVRE